jgi:hypothetical protein
MLLISNSKILLNGVAMGSTVTSDKLDIGAAVGYSVHFVWTLDVLGSNDGTNFTTVWSGSVGADSGDELVNHARANYRYIKARYTRTSGSGGALTARATMKAA